MGNEQQDRRQATPMITDLYLMFGLSQQQITSFSKETYLSLSKVFFFSVNFFQKTRCKYMGESKNGREGSSFWRRKKNNI